MSEDKPAVDKELIRELAKLLDETGPSTGNSFSTMLSFGSSFISRHVVHARLQ